MRVFLYLQVLLDGSVLLNKLAGSCALVLLLEPRLDHLILQQINSHQSCVPVCLCICMYAYPPIWHKAWFKQAIHEAMSRHGVVSLFVHEHLAHGFFVWTYKLCLCSLEISLHMLLTFKRIWNHMHCT